MKKRADLASKEKRGTIEFTEANNLLKKKIKKISTNTTNIERIIKENKSLKVLRKNLNNN